MTRLLARLLLAVAAALAAPVVCSGLFIALVEATSWRWDFEALLASELATAMLFVLAWTVVWRGQVTWTPWRRQLTLLSVFWSIGFGSLIGVAFEALTNTEEVGVIFAGLFWFICWIPSTALVWRETARERATRLKMVAVGAVACPNCGYNLTGLREARCPECGTQYTLNELFATLQERTDELDSKQPA